MTDTVGRRGEDLGFLVPVSDSPTLEATVEYAAREAREVAAEADGAVSLWLVAPVGRQTPPGSASADAERLLADAKAVADRATEITDPAGSVDVETETLVQYRYPLDPYEYVDALVEFAADRGIETLVMDPEHRLPGETPIVRSLADELREADADAFDLEVAPVERRARQGRLVTRGGAAQFLAIFGLSFGFYVLLGGFEEPTFDAVTGAVSALLVAGVFSRITFEATPRPSRMLSSVGRWILYVPYLLAKIVIANVQIAYVVLHPSLPIDPSIERFEAGVWGGLPVATLANSITLTPGTLTVDVRDGEFAIHSLTAGSREDLLDGGLERAVRFVFYGRSAMRYPSPRERAGEDGDSS